MNRQLNHYKLGALCNIKHGYPFDGSKFTDHGTYIVLTPGNFFEKGGFKRIKGKEKYYSGAFPQEYLCSKNDLIVAMTQQAEGLLGSTALVPEDKLYLHNQRVGLISHNKDLVDKLYLYYLFMTKSVRKQISDSASGTKIRHTSPDKIYSVAVAIPNVDIQRKNALLLHSIDEKIANNSLICSELEAMAKTLYDYWFVQFDFPDENGRPYRASGGKMVWNEQLKREIPKGWESKCITEVFDVCYGYPFDTNQFVEEDIGSPVIRIRDILEATVSARTIETVDEKYWVYSGDLIVGMDGNFHMNFWNGDPALLNQRCFKVSPKEDSVMIAYFSSMPYIKAREKNVTRTTVGHLGADDIKSLYVAYPIENNIRKYLTSVFDRILEKMCLAREENRELSKLRDWLLPMLMNGQAKVE